MKSLAAGKNTDLKLILHENFYKGKDNGAEVALAVIKTGAPVKVLAAELGAVKTIYLLSEIVRRYCSQFNVSKNMTPDQIEDLAAEMYLDFKDRKGNSVMLEELIIVFDRAAKGEFCDPDTGKKIVPFDRIDRGLIESFLDVYFETDRTAAIWQIEDEREKLKRLKPPPGEDFRLSNEGGAAEPTPLKDIYSNLAGKPGALPLAKLMKDMEQKYGGDDAEK